MRGGVGSVLVPSPWPEASPSARFCRSKPLSPWLAREDGDNRWGHPVGDSVFQNGIFPFLDLNEY